MNKLQTRIYDGTTLIEVALIEAEIFWRKKTENEYRAIDFCPNLTTCSSEQLRESTAGVKHILCRSNRRQYMNIYFA